MEKEPNRNEHERNNLVKNLTRKHPQEIESCSFGMEDEVRTVIYIHTYTYMYVCILKNMTSISKTFGIYSKDQTNFRTHGAEEGPEINSKGISQIV